MAIHPQAGLKASPEQLIDVADLLSDYYLKVPDVNDPAQKVTFGTSGHRGNAALASFNEAHIFAITQAICDYRVSQSITGPLYLAKDTHALSTPAEKTALQVLAANGVNVRRSDDFTPTPAVSHAILTYNHSSLDSPADGVVITPSHNPPDNGGFKYNPPNGGPADSDATSWIADRANQYLAKHNAHVKQMSYADALASESTQDFDFMTPYVEDLKHVINMPAIRDANIAICADAMGGSGMAYWQAIADTYDIKIHQRNTTLDYTFSFMTLDKDGKIRMDCSSASAMAS
ncbi:MAG: phosphoglucomutase [Gammaproteobacteria bacterium]